MARRFILGGYWLARSERVEKCAEDVGSFLARLSSIAPVFADWYETGRSRKDALERKVDIRNLQKLEALLLKGRIKRDVGGDIIKELGFNVDLWNGASRDGSEASVSIHCGSSTSRVGNYVVVDLPALSADWVDRAYELLEATAEIWVPDWAGIMSSQAMQQRSPGSKRPVLDWMVYVPRAIKSVPAPARVESLGQLGSIVVLQPDLPGEDTAGRSALVQEIEGLLDV